MDVQAKIQRLGILVQDIKAYVRHDIVLDVIEIITDELQRLSLTPTEIIPNADGIGMVFVDRCKYRYVDVQVFNSGAIIVLMLTGIPPHDKFEVFHIKDHTTLSKDLDYIKLFLNGKA